MSRASSSIQEKIKMRNLAYTKVRHFFHERNVLEVDTPSIIPHPIIDQYIEPMTVDSKFLRTSAEYDLKKLLANGAPDIYEIGHVFRKGEKGRKHNPEFTMIEWYRLGFTLAQLIEETLQLIQLFCKDLPTIRWTYQNLFQTFLNINPLSASAEELKIHLPKQAPRLEDKDEILHFLITHQIEPHLQKDIHVVQDFPKSQCALARIENGVAKRFEIYVSGLEVANGYDELCSTKEQKERFEEENCLRKKSNKPTFELDDTFLSSLDDLPPCCGVAVGFDRLLMLASETKDIQQVIF